MAEVLKKQRKSNFSPEEVDVLVRTVGKNYETLYGEFSKRAVNKNARHIAWIDVTKKVNEVGSEKRTLQEVKNKWKKCQHLYRAEDFIGVSEELVNPDDRNVWEPLTSIEDEDSMPLEQRLKTPTAEQDAILHSQPLSPTKLKVTRQTKQTHSSPKSPTPPPQTEEVCLKWNSHHYNMQNSFPNLLLKEQYVDATLVSEGQTLKCHRVILSSCSPYFEDILASINPSQHPVLFMKDVPFWILKSLCDFMYSGEVHILQTKLEELLAVAEILKIKGLAGTIGNAEHDIKTEPGKPIKEERKDESEIIEEEMKKKDVKEFKRKDDKDLKKREDFKKREEMKEVKDKKRPQPAPPPEMPVLKSAKLSKVSSHTEMPILQSTKTSKNYTCSRRAVRRIDKTEKVTKKPSNDFFDPLDLLEPVYEELTKEPISSTIPMKPKDTKPIPMRRSLTKKLKKRKITDEREESPPPVLSRKGTRSRPNRKVPKFYHSNYDQSTIVREPHTDQADPLMHLQEIKAEPLDLEENTIEIEDNLVDFSENDITVEDEEIMGDYYSPIVNLNADNKETDSSVAYPKIGLISQPIIMNVESVTEKNEDALKLINLAKIKGKEGEKVIDPLEDPLNFNQNSSDIHSNIIQNVLESNENSLGFHISEVVTEKEESPSAEECEELTFQITNIISEQDDNEVIENPQEQVNKTKKDLEHGDIENNKHNSEKESVSSNLQMNEKDVDDSPDKTEENCFKSDSLENLVVKQFSDSTETVGGNSSKEAETDILDHEQSSDTFRESDTSNLLEELQLKEISKKLIDTKDTISTEEGTDSMIDRVTLEHFDESEELNINCKVESELCHRVFSKEESTVSDLRKQDYQVIHEENHDESTSSTCTEVGPSCQKFDQSPLLVEIDPTAASTTSVVCQNDSSTTEFQYSPEEKFSRDGFLIDDYIQDSVSPGTVGFHIAQVISEQIAQNEENKITDQCIKDSSSQSVGEERYTSNSNELETIVNDLTKIVGETCDQSDLKSNEDSSVIAESLENLLQD